MSTLETLKQRAYDENVILLSAYLPPCLKGLYYSDGEFCSVTLNKRIDRTDERCCVLAEELGHHYTTPTDLFSAPVHLQNRYERRAKKWAALELIPLSALVKAHRQGVRTFYELAEALGVTEPFLMQSIQLLAEHYGLYTRYYGYTIYFNPLRITEVSS